MSATTRPCLDLCSWEGLLRTRARLAQERLRRDSRAFWHKGPMDLKTDFDEFLTAIRPTENQKKNLKTGHSTLRARLKADETVKKVHVSDFLQGSYRRATAVRPNDSRRADVDIVLVTKLSEDEYTPAQAMDLFKPFLDKHYNGKWRQQGRSFGIELEYVELDLVLTSAPSEAEKGILESDAVTSDDDLEEARDWRLNTAWVELSKRQLFESRAQLAQSSSSPEWATEPLRIPDRDANKWEDTHPVEQIRWTRDKNARTNRHFVNVVKALKWWRLEKHPEPKHPKGFPLERLIGECCPDAVDSVAAGITLTLEKIKSQYKTHADTSGKPDLKDYGVPTHDVFKRISPDDFKKFYDQAVAGAELARRAFDSTDRSESGNLWRELLGNKFPKPPSGGGSKNSGYTPPTGPATPGSGRFA